MQLHCISAKERLAVPKKLLACNTKLMTVSLAIVKMKLSWKHLYIQQN